MSVRSTSAATAPVARTGARGPAAHLLEHVPADRRSLFDCAAWVREHMAVGLDRAELDRLRRQWPRRLLVKGLLPPDDVRRVAAAGREGAARALARGPGRRPAGRCVRPARTWKGRPMRSTLITDGSERTWALVFETGDEVMAGLERFAREQRLDASRFSAIGAFSDATLGYFDWQKKDYERIPVDEQVEVLSLLGDVALHDGAPKVHAHVVLGRRDGGTRGGHLLEARVRPTLEVLLVESPGHLAREIDAGSGLPLIRIRR
jgi:hypothetical protein